MENKVKVELKLRQKQMEKRSVSSRLLGIVKSVSSKMSSESTSNFACKPTEMLGALEAKRAEAILCVQRHSMFK